MHLSHVPFLKQFNTDSQYHVFMYLYLCVMCNWVTHWDVHQAWTFQAPARDMHENQHSPVHLLDFTFHLAALGSDWTTLYSNTRLLLWIVLPVDENVLIIT